MIERAEWTVPADAAGLRLDQAVLRQCPESTRGLVLEAIAAGRVQINGRVECSKGFKLAAGDRIVAGHVETESDVRILPNPAVPFDLIHEDAALVAISKPACIPCHPLHHRERDTLMNGLVARWPELEFSGNEPLLAGGLLHRIDEGTSGLVLAARTREAWMAMRAAFRKQEVSKVYLAVVHGRVEKPGRCESELAHRPHGAHRMELARGHTPRGERPLYAVTEYEPLESQDGLTLLRVTIRTGVTHQIRFHLSHEGWPLVGDVLYGAPGREASLGRHYLHAQSIAFTHPASGVACVWSAPLPLEFSPSFVLDRLSRLPEAERFIDSDSRRGYHAKPLGSREDTL